MKPQKDTNFSFSNGDSPAKVDIRIKHPKRMRKSAVAFDLAFESPTPEGREARMNLIRLYHLTGDVEITRALRLQESNAAALMLLRATFGDDFDWRLRLCLYARYVEDARAELDEYCLKCIAEQNGDGLREIAKCFDAINNRDKDSCFNNKLSALATVFAWKYYEVHGVWPPRPTVREYLKQEGLDPVYLKNQKRDLWTGPILSRCPKGKSGRPSNRSKSPQ